MANSSPRDELPPMDDGQTPAANPAPSPAPPRLIPRRSLGRRIFRVFSRLVLLLAIIGAISLFFRLELVNRAGPWLLGREFAVPVDLSFRNLDWRGAHIDRLTLGSQRDLIVEDVDLTYNPWDGRLETVSVGRVALLARYDTTFTMGELDPLIDQLRALAAAPGDPNKEAAPLPDVLVKSIEIGLSSPAGFITGTGQANISNQAIIAQFTLREQQDYARVDISLAAPLAKGGKPPLGDLTLTMDAHSALWSLFGLAQPSAGNVKMNAHLRMPEGAATADASTALAMTDWSMEVNDFAYPGLSAPLTGTLKGVASYGTDWLALEKLDGNFTGALDAKFKATLGGDVRVAPLRAAQELTGALTLKSDGGDVTLAGIAFKQPKLALDLALSGKLDVAGGGTLDIGIAKPSSFSAQHIDTLATGMVLPLPTTLALKPDAGSFAHLAFGGIGGFRGDFGAVLGKSVVTLEPKDTGERLLIAMPDSKITGQFGGQMPFTFALDLKGAQVAAPAHGLTLGNVTLAMTSDDKGLRAKLSTGALAGLGAFTPVRGEAEATLLDGKAEFKAHFTGDDQPVDLSVTGKADLGKMSGTADVKLAALDFAVDGLQPYNLFPPLRDYLDDVSGRVELAGPVRFSNGDLTSGLKFGLTDFSGKVGPMQLTRVNSVIEIDKPWPFSTKPNQVVAVELADIGLPLTNALFRFKISDGKRLDLQESALEMAGGKVSLDPATLLLDAPAHNLKLTVDGISVGELFDTLGIAGLSGEGSISGEVPVTIFPGGIAIPDAKLAATAPGVLRYDRNQAPLALQSAGESVAMALEALADFHYEKLMLDLTRNLTGDVSLGLHISGRNPSFYDGYPVEFNLTVEGRLDQALKEGLAGYKVPDMIQQQLEKLTP